MSVRVTRAVALKQMEDLKLPYWIVRDGRSVVGEHEGDGNLKESMEALEDLLNSLQGDYVTIVLHSMSNEQKGKGGVRSNVKREFTVLLNSGVGMSGAGGGNVNISLVNENKALQAQVMQLQFDKRIDDLRRELTEDKDDGLSGVVEKHLPVIMQFITGKTMFPSGAEATSLAGVESDVDKINSLLQRWANVDRDYLKTMEGVVKLAETQREQYNTAKQYIGIR